MQRDEDLLLDGWCRYHGNLFGYENLFIFDNDSKTKTVKQTLEKYRRLGCQIDLSRDQMSDFTFKGEIVGNLFKSLQESGGYDFFLPLDCDEFVSVLRGNTVSFQKTDIKDELGRFAGCPDTIKISDEFVNSPNYPDHYYRLNSNKTAFAAQHFDHTDHGYHTPGTMTGEWAFSSLVFIHYHNKPFTRTLSDATRKLAGLGVDVSNPEAVRNLTHSMHLKPYFTMSEAEFLSSFDRKCHLPIPGFTQHLTDLGVSSPVLTPRLGAQRPPLLFPPDFDEAGYLALHPDVAASDLTGSRHYMLFGAAEGRECARHQT